MTPFKDISLDVPLCSRHLDEFENLLSSKDELSEQKDVLPFFQQHEQLVVLIGMINTLVFPDRICEEFAIFGDFRCDYAIGQKDKGVYTFIEFEDARKDSIFKKRGKKGTREWGRRFNQGYSQIIDWAHQLDDLRRTHNMKKQFAHELISYEFMLVIGRSNHFLDGEPERLKWRSDIMRLGTPRINCLTFDELLTSLRVQHHENKRVYDAGVSFGARISPTNTSPGDPASGKSHA